MTGLKLHDYQEVAREHLRANPRAGLFLDMGLGKTATCLMTLGREHLPVLVVAPKRVAEEVWPVEVPKWRPDLSVALAAGTPAKRRKALQSGADIIVIGRDNIADAVPMARTWRTIILDELSSYKTKASARWRAANKIIRASNAPYVWGLTGTPSPNGLLDLWAQVHLLDGGERLGRNLSGFRSRYFTPGRQLPTGVITSWDIRPEADAKIHQLIDDICLAMETDGRIDLPPVTFNEVTVPLSSATLLAYRTLKRDFIVDLDMLGGIHSAGTAAAVSNKLSQISAGFIYDDEGDGYDIVHHDKVRALREIVDGTGAPVMVFYRYRAEREMIQRAMPELVHTLDEPGAVARWNAGELPVLLSHPASAGHGLNLQHGGCTIVWTSLPWSLEEWNQANKRLHRQGQDQPVIIHMLMSPYTVDFAVKQALDGKEDVQSALLRHLESPL